MILTCKQLVERVTDARERRLSAVDRVGYAVHLGWCGRCRRFVRQLDRTVEALGAMPAESAPRELRRAILARRRR
ncbi:MAG: anti-sigma factor family protein [Polyangia bacterium]